MRQRKRVFYSQGLNELRVVSYKDSLKVESDENGNLYLRMTRKMLDGHVRTSRYYYIGEY